MQRAVALATRVSAASLRSVRVTVGSRAAAALGGTLSNAVAWPPSATGLSLSTTTSNTSTGAAGAAAGSAISTSEEDEDDTTRFKTGQSHDRGPSGNKVETEDAKQSQGPREQRVEGGKTESARATGQSTTGQNSMKTSEKQGKSGDRQQKKQGSGNRQQTGDDRRGAKAEGKGEGKQAEQQTGKSPDGSQQQQRPKAAGQHQGGKPQQQQAKQPKDASARAVVASEQKAEKAAAAAAAKPRSSDGGSVDAASDGYGSVEEDIHDLIASAEESAAAAARRRGDRVLSDRTSQRYAAVFGEQINDTPYNGPAMDAIVTSSGRVFPLDDEDAERMAGMLPSVGSGAAASSGASAVARVTAPSSPERVERAKAAAVTNVLFKRSMRANYDDGELEQYVRAIEMQFGRGAPGAPETSGLTSAGAGQGLEGAASNMWSRRIADDYRPGEDPLLDHLTPSATTAGTATSTGAAASKAASSGSARKPANATTGGLPFDASAVTFITNMTWNAAPGSRWTDETAHLTARVSSLGLDAATCQYIRAIAGPRYDAVTDVLKIASDRHPDAAMNKREALQTLVSLVNESASMSQAFGAMPVKKVKHAYTH